MISIVIPNYNSGEKIANNLPKLQKLLSATKLKYEIIVSDDASSDNSILKIENCKLKIVRSTVNTGFGSNVDRGIRASKGEIIFVLNLSDALPKNSDYFKIMLKHFENPNIFSVAAAKKDSENHGSGKIYFDKGFYLHRRGDGGQFTDWADGGAQALKREYYLKIGGFDPKYKLYWEDVDLGYRANKAGYKIIFEPEAILVHQKSEGPIAKNYSPEEIKTMNYYGQFIFTWKHASFSQWLKHLFFLPSHFLIAIKNHDWLFFRAFLQALLKIM